MYVHNINPTLLSFGPFEIRFYGIVYALALLGLVWWLQRAAAAKKLDNFSRERAMDFVIACMVSMLIGARLMHVLTRIPYYSEHPLKVLFFWEGGLAFYGGFIATLACGYYLTKRWELDFWKLADLIIVPIPLFLMLGRIANFINAELPGRVTDVSWAVLFPEYIGYRHPSQLYDAFLMLITFILLLLLWRSELREKKGFIFWSFVTIYGVMRSTIEFFRVPDEVQLFGISWTHYSSFVMIALGVVMLARMHSAKNQ